MKPYRITINFTVAAEAAEDADYSERWATIIDKVCADRIGPGAHPVGAIGLALSGTEAPS